VEIGLLLIGILVGAVGAWLVASYKFRSEASQAESAQEVARERQAAAVTQLEGLKQELETERKRTTELTASLSATEADFRNLQTKLQEQKAEVEQLREKFTLEFRHLANEIFEEKSKKFTDQNKVNLGEILNPLKERIVDFERKVEETNKQSIAQNSSLKEQLNQLKELNQQINKEAMNLTKALKGDTKAQGNWGEYILETILEKSGLRKGNEYVQQESLTSEDGKRLQPDVVVNLPDSKHIIIDAKVSLIAYERFSSAEDEHEKALALKQHIQSLRLHVKGLSDKNYQHLYQIGSLDFVLLFVPIEPAFSLAVQHDSQLFLDAYDKNIVMVSPSTLIATLRTISSIWKNEFQNRNALEIARQAGAMYDKFSAFTDDLIKVGKNLESTQNVYREAMNKLTDGKGNIIGRVEKLRELGAKTSKTIDQRLLDRSSEDNQ
jgi:DNA recombination protein RmuC